MQWVKNQHIPHHSEMNNPLPLIRPQHSICLEPVPFPLQQDSKQEYSTVLHEDEGWLQSSVVVSSASSH